ncbi:MAG: hypothetical protein QOD00_2308 [Blastocatellia bacterium]|jgi:molecular chaperone GrpE (heat shock protein)|nr:hypothetical protein [Blastocatellia bacterium]
MYEFLLRLFPWLGDRREEEELALRIEASALKLSGLAERSRSAPGDLKAILSSTVLLLERLAVRAATRQDEEHESKAVVDDESNAMRDESAAVEDERAREVGPTALPLTQAAPVSQPAAGPEISSAAKELIKLRDWVLLAKSGEIASPASVLEGLYRKLGQLLQKEGLTALEAAGPFDEERQQIIETQPTEDPSQDNVVCDTVRPGYLFNGQLVRPQEVILYTYDN